MKAHLDVDDNDDDDDNDENDEDDDLALEKERKKQDREYYVMTTLIIYRFQRVLTMVYNTRDYRVFGLCPSSGIQ
jgi:hypothetical protein